MPATPFAALTGDPRSTAAKRRSTAYRRWRSGRGVFASRVGRLCSRPLVRKNAAEKVGPRRPLFRPLAATPEYRGPRQPAIEKASRSARLFSAGGGASDKTVRANMLGRKYPRELSPCGRVSAAQAMFARTSFAALVAPP